MKHPRVLLAILAVGSTAQAFEFTAPVPHRQWEVQPGVSYSSARGSYDGSGDFHDLPSGASRTSTVGMVRAKYGLFPEGDLEFTAGYNWEKVDLGWISGSVDGWSRPEIALKWMGTPGIGLGASVFLPVGSNAIVGKHPFTSFLFAGLVSQEGERWLVDGGVGYLKTLEKDANQPGGALVASLKPRFKLDPRVSMSVEMIFAKAFEGEVEGRSDGNDGYVFNVAPGAQLGLSNTESIELSVPFSLVGKKATAIWGLDLRMHWRFGV